MDTYTFQDIFDMDFLQKLIDSLSVALQVGISIRGPKGERFTKDSDYCRFCRDVVKKSPVGRARCDLSDRALSAHNDEKPYICHCQSAGLTDASVPIIVEGRHLASILVGQVRLAEDVPEEEEYRTNARILQLLAEIFKDGNLLWRAEVRHFHPGAVSGGDIGHLNLRVAADLGQAGQPPAGGVLLAGDVAVDGGVQTAGGQPDPAFAAYAVAGAGGVDGHIGFPGHIQELFTGVGVDRHRIAGFKAEGDGKHSK